MPYSETTAVWSGFVGAPGYTKFRWLGTATTTTADAMLAKSRAFFASLSTYLPPGVTIAHNQAVDQYDDNHDKTGTVTAPTAVTAVTGSGTGVFNARAGAWINWQTDSWAAGRRVVGRTFIVPTSPTQTWQSDGTLVASFQSALVAAGQALFTGTPTLVLPWGPRVHLGASLLGIATVTACTVKDKGGVLRSRGD